MNSLNGRGSGPVGLKGIRQYGPLLPALGLVGLLYGGGLLLALAQSVGLYGLGERGFTLQGYGELLLGPAVGWRGWPSNWAGLPRIRIFPCG